jgi:hypothetical protein
VWFLNLARSRTVNARHDCDGKVRFFPKPDLLRTDASSLNRGATGDDTELGSREIFERAAEFAEGRSRRRENNDFLF